jgi:pantothenate kinase-related protein Tda10
MFEDWCLGASPKEKVALNVPVNSLERKRDSDCSWREYANHPLV